MTFPEIRSASTRRENEEETPFVPAQQDRVRGNERDASTQVRGERTGSLWATELVVPPRG